MSRVSLLLAAAAILVAPGLAFAQTFCILVVEEMLGRVTIVSAADPDRRVSVPVGFKPHEIIVSPDGRTAYVSMGSVVILDANTGNLIKSLRTGTPLRVGMSPDRDLAYVANVGPAGRTLTVVHLHSLETDDIAGLRDVNGLAFSSTLPLAFGEPQPQPRP